MDNGMQINWFDDEAVCRAAREGGSGCFHPGTDWAEMRKQPFVRAFEKAHRQPADAQMQADKAKVLARWPDAFSRGAVWNGWRVWRKLLMTPLGIGDTEAAAWRDAAAKVDAPTRAPYVPSERQAVAEEPAGEPVSDERLRAARVSTLETQLAEALQTAVRIAGERDDARAQLATCYRLTGADPDGDDDWRLAQRTVTEVKRLREECDAAESRRDELFKIGQEKTERILALERELAKYTTPAEPDALKPRSANE